MSRDGSRRYPPAEYERTEGAPLEPARLAQIWATLPEVERFPFVLALDEAIADKVITLTAPARPAEERIR